MRHVAVLLILLAGASAAQQQAKRPDGLYAEIRTSKGLIVARLEADLTPLTVANFVGLAEGTIANSAFDPGRPFYDGSVYHRVVPGHVIQTGIPQSDRAKSPGYTFPNEIHARLSHNHAGALNMANGGPNTNASQFCITLGDRSYLDGDFNVFGDVVEGMDVVMRIAKGDVVQTVRIIRVGAKAQASPPHHRVLPGRWKVRAARQRVAEHVEEEARRGAGLDCAQLSESHRAKCHRASRWSSNGAVGRRALRQRTAPSDGQRRLRFACATAAAKSGTWGTCSGGMVRRLRRFSSAAARAACPAL